MTYTQDLSEIFSELFVFENWNVSKVGTMAPFEVIMKKYLLEYSHERNWKQMRSIFFSSSDKENKYLYRMFRIFQTYFNFSKVLLRMIKHIAP